MSQIDPRDIFISSLRVLGADRDPDRSEVVMRVGAPGVVIIGPGAGEIDRDYEKELTDMALDLATGAASLLGETITGPAGEKYTICEVGHGRVETEDFLRGETQWLTLLESGAVVALFELALDGRDHGAGVRWLEFKLPVAVHEGNSVCRVVHTPEAFASRIRTWARNALLEAGGDA